MKKFFLTALLFSIFISPAAWAQEEETQPKSAAEISQTDPEQEAEIEFVHLDNQFISEVANRNINSMMRFMKLLGFDYGREGTEKFLGLSYFSWACGAAFFALNSLVFLVAIKGVFPLLIFLSKKRRLFFLENLFKSIKPCVAALLVMIIVYSTLFAAVFELSLIWLFQPVISSLLLFIFLWFIIRVFDAVSLKAEHALKYKYGFRELLPLLRKTLRALLLTVMVLVFLDKMGVNVSNVVVSLGIGGAALAFASKDTIANFFGSISLIMDTPFKIGDRIQVAGKLDGTVEGIGMRSTRIRNLDQTLSILPNSYLANEYIVNVSMWARRKISIKIGLTYSTTAAQMKAIVSDLNDMFAETDGVDQESTNMAAFDSFGDSAMNISILYYTANIDYVSYTLTQQRVNYAIMRIVEKHGASFAFPSTSVYIENQK